MPAVWTYGDNWPYDGEIDIIEGVNTAHTNILSAHTADGCTQSPTIDGLYSGQLINTECAVGENNIGCGFHPSAEDTSSYGDGFNAAHGGVYAMEWDSVHIRIWHFARGEIPRDIEEKKPDPETWGLPIAVFGGESCDVDEYFKRMRLVLNIVSLYISLSLPLLYDERKTTKEQGRKKKKKKKKKPCTDTCTELLRRLR